MAVARRTPKVVPMTAAALAEMSPSARVAHEIITARSDLAPSVNKIMDADLSDSQRLTAITKFSASISAIDDPFRDPRYAIAHCGADDRA
jgi:hypothetical protein